MSCSFRKSAVWAIAVMVCPAPAYGQVFGPHSAILDQAGVVDARSEAALNRYLLELQQKTGAQVRVLTVASTGDRDIYDYASDVFRSQNRGKGLGDKKGSNNGLLIVVAVQDRKFRFHVGEGLEGTLPDLYCNTIGDKYFVPSFRRGDFASGLVQGTVAAAQKIAADAGVQLTGTPRVALPQRRRRGGMSCFWPLLLIFLISGGGVFGRRRHGYYRTWGGGGLLQGMVLGSLLGSMMGGRRSWSGGSSFGGGLGGGFGGGGFGGGGGSFGGGGCTGGW